MIVKMCSPVYDPIKDEWKFTITHTYEPDMLEYCRHTYVNGVCTGCKKVVTMATFTEPAPHMNKSKEEILEEFKNQFGAEHKFRGSTFIGWKHPEDANMIPTYNEVFQWLSETLTHSQNREAEIRKEENRLFMETMQKRADTVPPNLLLNEIVNYTYDRIEALTPEQLEDKQ